MGKVTGFLEISRREAEFLPIKNRIKDYKEFVILPDDRQLIEQGARCMDCGTPFCQTGCPVNNIIPDWNDLVYRNNWLEAYRTLTSTNNFPEFTGRICPAPCESACTLYFNDDPVTIKNIEQAIIDKAFSEGWVTPQIAQTKSDRKVAVIGSGPSGLACAQQLARTGHQVTVYEKHNRIGGLLRYGIPDFKMEKHLIDRRIEQMEEEGVVFKTNQHVGQADNSIDSIVNEHDAVALCIGCEHPRDLEVEGRELDGVHFALDFLQPNNKVVAGDKDIQAITAVGKNVVVIGGGDTGSDCIGTSTRHQAAKIMQFELLSQPPESENRMLSWPNWPLKLRTSSSHQEGCNRDWEVATTRLSGNGKKVNKLHYKQVEWGKDSEGRHQMDLVGEEQTIDADLVLLAMGYIHPRHDGLLEQLKVEYDQRGNVKADTKEYQTSVPRIFAAGDARRGQSLVVWAIREGRQCARAIDKYLTGSTDLPR